MYEERDWTKWVCTQDVWIPQADICFTKHVGVKELCEEISMRYFASIEVMIVDVLLPSDHIKKNINMLWSRRKSLPSQVYTGETLTLTRMVQSVPDQTEWEFAMSKLDTFCNSTYLENNVYIYHYTCFNIS